MFCRWPAYGGYIISATTFALTAVGTFSLRGRLKLFSDAKAMSYVFAPLGPTLMSGTVYHHYVVQPILNGE